MCPATWVRTRVTHTDQGATRDDCSHGPGLEHSRYTLNRLFILVSVGLQTHHGKYANPLPPGRSHTNGKARHHPNLLNSSTAACYFHGSRPGHSTINSTSQTQTFSCFLMAASHKPHASQRCCTTSVPRGTGSMLLEASQVSMQRTTTPYAARAPTANASCPRMHQQQQQQRWPQLVPDHTVCDKPAQDTTAAKLSYYT